MLDSSFTFKIVITIFSPCSCNFLPPHNIEVSLTAGTVEWVQIVAYYRDK